MNHKAIIAAMSSERRKSGSDVESAASDWIGNVIVVSLFEIYHKPDSGTQIVIILYWN